MHNWEGKKDLHRHHLFVSILCRFDSFKSFPLGKIIYRFTKPKVATIISMDAPDPSTQINTVVTQQRQQE